MVRICWYAVMRSSWRKVCWAVYYFKLFLFKRWIYISMHIWISLSACLTENLSTQYYHNSFHNRPTRRGTNVKVFIIWFYFRNYSFSYVDYYYQIMELNWLMVSAHWQSYSVMSFSKVVWSWPSPYLMGWTFVIRSIKFINVQPQK